MRFYSKLNADVGPTTVEYNLTAFNYDAAFGCGGRMGLLIYPIIPYYRFNKNVKILIVGCRTEDDIYWLRSYGYNKTLGFDLFSYSNKVLLGDIHDTDFDDDSFDVVLLGWMISYSKNPKQVIKECVRITKKEGLIGIGIDHDPDQGKDVITDEGPRVNELNNADELIDLFAITKNKVVFNYDHQGQSDHAIAVITRIFK